VLTVMQKVIALHGSNILIAGEIDAR
jgi:hypothetical protein